MSRQFFLFFLVAVFLMLTIIPGMSVSKEITEKCGDMEFACDSAKGLYLTVHGIEIIRGSRLMLITPNWSEVYFDASRDSHLKHEPVIEEYDGGKRITLPILHKELETGEEIVQGKQVITLLPDNLFKYDLEITLIHDKETHLEWEAAGLNPAPLIGCPYKAKTDSGSISGVFPVDAPGNKVDDCTYADNINQLSVDSRLGSIAIEASPETKLILFDYRKNIWADFKNPIFWMGRLQRPFRKGETIRYSYSIKFPERAASAEGSIPLLEAHVDAAAVERMRIPSWGDKDIIIPQPKMAVFTGKRMPLQGSVRIFMGDDPSLELNQAAAFLEKDLLDLFKIKTEFVKGDFPPEPSAGDILLGGGGLQAPAESICSEAGLKTPDHYEGYALLVADDKVVISSKTAKGVFYGITSLVQLLAVDEDGVYLKGAEITDYPSLDFRGIHCFTAKDGGEEISQAVRDLMARFKINTLVWECWPIIWDCTAGIANPDIGMAKMDALKVVNTARENFIEIIPLIQTLGHVNWMFRNGQNMELAEDPDFPYAYCPTNPDTYKFVFTLFEEVLDFFKPRALHIGHDEITTESRARFPYRSKDSGKSVTDLIMTDIDKLHAWLKDRDVKTMLWGDMFLGKGDASSVTNAPSREIALERRNRLPDDVIIADWHYEASQPEEFTSLSLFKKMGLSVVGCTWHGQDNIARFSEGARLMDAAGMMVTTWAGFNFRINGNQELWHQYWAYITGAHYFWSDDTTPPDDLPFRSADVFARTWFQDQPVLEAVPGFTVDLAPYANRNLVDTDQRDGWLGLGPELDLSGLDVARKRFDGILFQIPRDEQGLKAVMLAGSLNPKGSFPGSIDFRLKSRQKAVEFHFLMTAAFRSKDGDKCGEIVIGYEDAHQESIDLVYARNIFVTSDNRLGRDARTVWEGKAKNGETVRLWDLNWKNPYPAREITSIKISSTGKEAAPIILGISGLKLK